MKFKVFMAVLMLIVLVFASGASFAEKQALPEVTADGLHRVAGTRLALVYAEPGADLSQYQRINMADAYVAFKKNWKRDQNRSSSNRVTPKQMESIKSDVAELFRTVITETLEKGGYQLVNELGEDVLIVRPAIINLDVRAPENRSATNVQTFSESAGEMTLYVELYDSVTGDLIAKALDPQADRERGYMQWQNRVTNRAAARRIMQTWADIMKTGLDEAKKVNGQ
jgi:hypothetical protein